MSKHYEAPAELRPLEKLLCEFAYNNGLDIRTVSYTHLRAHETA